MKKTILSLSILFSVSAYSQTMTLINNTSDLIKVKELWTNDFCAYDFPTVEPQVDEAPNANQWIPAFSASTIFNFPAMGTTHDFEYVELEIYDRATMSLITTQDLGTDATVMYDPAACAPAGPPTTTPITWLPVFWPGPGGVGGVWSVGVPPVGPVNGIRQVIKPNFPTPSTAPSFTATGAGGKIYRFTWLTVFNSTTGKYDVEITVN